MATDMTWTHSAYNALPYHLEHVGVSNIMFNVFEVLEINCVYSVCSLMLHS